MKRQILLNSGNIRPEKTYENIDYIEKELLTKYFELFLEKES